MKDYYETPEGYKLLKSWAQADDGTDHWENIYNINEKIAYKAIKKLVNRLVITEPNKSYEYFMNGFAYTSSSNYAALWQCQSNTYKPNTNIKFSAMALTTDSKPVAVYNEYTSRHNGEFIRTIYEEII